METIFKDRVEGNTITLSLAGDGYLKEADRQGLKLINDWDFPVTNGNRSCMDFNTLIRDKFYIYKDTIFSNAFELTSKDSNGKTFYRDIVRHYLLKRDGSVWVKQYVYDNKTSIFNESYSYRKSLCNVPSMDVFTEYYSGLYILHRTPSGGMYANPPIPIPCIIEGILTENEDTELRNLYDLYVHSNDQANVDKIAGEYYELTDNDISRGNNGLKLALTTYYAGEGEIQKQSNYGLYYVAPNDVIQKNQTLFNNLGEEVDPYNFNPIYDEQGSSPPTVGDLNNQSTGVNYNNGDQNSTSVVNDGFNVAPGVNGEEPTELNNITPYDKFALTVSPNNTTNAQDSTVVIEKEDQNLNSIKIIGLLGLLGIGILIFK